MISGLDSRASRWRWAWGFLGIGVLLLLLGVIAWFFPQPIFLVDSGPAKAEMMVILGGGDERVRRAVELFQAGEAPVILLSGQGDGDWHIQMLQSAGVPLDVVQREDRSRNTFENARCSVALLRAQGVHRVIIVTSWYHSRRALACFEHWAPEMTFYSRPAPVPDPLHTSLARQRAEQIYLRIEYFKLLGYWLWHGVCPIGL